MKVLSLFDGIRRYAKQTTSTARNAYTTTTFLKESFFVERAVDWEDKDV